MGPWALGQPPQDGDGGSRMPVAPPIWGANTAARRRRGGVNRLTWGVPLQRLPDGPPNLGSIAGRSLPIFTGFY